MPEGPEVSVMAEQLDALARGKVVMSLEWEGAPENAAGLAAMPPRLTVEGVGCRGKKILFRLAKPAAAVRGGEAGDGGEAGQGRASESGGVLVSAPMMTGRWLLRRGAHTKAVLALGVRRGPFLVRALALYFDDARGLGELAYAPDAGGALAKALEGVGPDLLQEPPALGAFEAALRRHPRLQVGSFLLRQDHFSGVGNYLKAEILYRARIAPGRRAGSLDAEERARLHAETLATIREARAAGGLTIRDYLAPDGRRGGYVPLVYGRAGEKVGGHAVVKEKFADGRGTYWVPGVQK